MRHDKSQATNFEICTLQIGNPILRRSCYTIHDDTTVRIKLLSQACHLGHLKRGCVWLVLGVTVWFTCYGLFIQILNVFPSAPRIEMYDSTLKLATSAYPHFFPDCPT